MALQAFKMIGEASRLLLEQGFKQEVVTEALGMVGKAIGVDRVYIFENSRAPDGSLLANQRFEWAEGSTIAQLDNPELQGVPMDAIAADWVSSLAAGEAVFGLSKDMSPGTRELLESQQIVSILVCPITLERKWWGFVGFDDCHSEREWPAVEVAVLKTLARALGGSLRHTQMRSTLASARTQLEQVLEHCATPTRA